VKDLFTLLLQHGSTTKTPRDLLAKSKVGDTEFAKLFESLFAQQTATIKNHRPLLQSHRTQPHEILMAEHADTQEYRHYSTFASKREPMRVTRGQEMPEKYQF